MPLVTINLVSAIRGTLSGSGTLAAVVNASGAGTLTAATNATIVVAVKAAASLTATAVLSGVVVLPVTAKLEAYVVMTGEGGLQTTVGTMVKSSALVVSPSTILPFTVSGSATVGPTLNADVPAVAQLSIEKLFRRRFSL